MIALVSFALAGDPVADALAAELARARDQLALPDAPRPYYIAYTLSDTRGFAAQASLGGLSHADDRDNMGVKVTVRVGSPEFDNSNFSDSIFEWFGSGASLLRDASPNAVRREAWLATDTAYKTAVESFSKKEAHRAGQVQRTRPPDFVLSSPTAVTLPVSTTRTDASAVTALVRRLSALFVGRADITSSQVDFGSAHGRTLLLDTLGASVQRPYDEVDLTVSARALADDGREVADEAVWCTRHEDALGSYDALVAEVNAMMTRLTAWRAAPAAEKAWEGPVVFADDAALVLFRDALLPSLRGTPPPERGEDRPMFGESSESPAAAEVGTRVLPKGWRVEDDPLADPSQASSYAYDDEGVPAQRVSLVEDGLVVSLYASRTPSKGVPVSNGHGRATHGGIARGEPAQTTVTAPKARTRAQLVKEALRLARLGGLDHAIIVRRFAAPLPNRGGRFSLSFLTSRSSSEGHLDLPAPLDVVRVYRDGHEVRVRGLSWAPLDPQLLRDVVVAGPTVRRALHYSTGSGFFSAHIPITLSAPEVLIPSLKLVPESGPPKLPSPVPSPYASH